MGWMPAGGSWEVPDGIKRAHRFQAPCVGLAQCPKRVWLGNVTRRPRKSRSFAEGIGTVMRIHVALSFDQVSVREPLLRRLEMVAPNEKGAPTSIMEAPVL